MTKTEQHDADILYLRGELQKLRDRLDVMELSEACEAVREESEPRQEDAARYRWLRENLPWFEGLTRSTPDKLDAMIDDGMREDAEAQRAAKDVQDLARYRWLREHWRHMVLDDKTWAWMFENPSTAAAPGAYLDDLIDKRMESHLEDEGGAP